MLIENSSVLTQIKKGGIQKTNKISYRKLHNGKIVKSVDEQYIRQDVPCGVKQCPFCDKNQSKSYLCVFNKITYRLHLDA